MPALRDVHPGLCLSRIVTAHHGLSPIAPDRAPARRLSVGAHVPVREIRRIRRGTPAAIGLCRERQWSPAKLAFIAIQTGRSIHEDFDT
jgi:hypothetical protein